MSLRLAYNTNGLQSHRLDEALELLADLGYDGVALTLDCLHLDPLRAGPAEVAAVARTLRRLRLACAVETGARFVLDPRRKHRPTLFDPRPLERMRRADLLRRSLSIAAELGAEVLTLPAGPVDPDSAPADARLFLLDGLRELLAAAGELGVPVALEPEPGHLIDDLAGWRALADELPELLLTLDVGHVSVARPEGTPAQAIRAHAARLGAVHLEDAPRGVHAHLPFGEGELDLPAVVGALGEVGYRGLCAVELSRHSHAAHETTAAAIAAIRAAEAG